MLKTDIPLTEAQLEGYVERWIVACGDFPQRLRGMEVRIVLRTIQRLKRRRRIGQPEANAFWLEKANQLWLALLRRETHPMRNTPLRIEWSGGGEIPSFHQLGCPSYYHDTRYQHLVLVLGRQRASMPVESVEETAWPFLDIIPGGITPADYDAPLDA